jgi:hypothetical protein
VIKYEDSDKIAHIISEAVAGSSRIIVQPLSITKEQLDEDLALEANSTEVADKQVKLFYGWRLHGNFELHKW